MWSLNLDAAMRSNIGRREGRVNWDALTSLTIGIGIFIRIIHFFINRSLWLDEIYLSSSLLRMDFFQLAMSPLDYQQQAPLGFLFLVKISLVVFGHNEMALRLIPLISGIAALFLFRPVASYLLSKKGVFIAVTLLAFAPLIIYHSVEIKQYSMSMLATVIALLLYIKYNNRFDWYSRITWAIAGATLIWFAYASIFILAGMAAAVCLRHISEKNWKGLLDSVAVFSFWMVSFIVYFFIYLRSSGESEWLISWFRGNSSFMPLPPTLETLKWMGHKFYRFLEYPLGLLLNWPEDTFSNFLLRNFMRMPLLPTVFFFTGVWVLIKTRRDLAMALFFPLVLLAVASGLELYPVYERLTVFVAPIIILVIAAGTVRFMNLRPVHNSRFVFMALLLIVPVYNSMSQLMVPELLGGYKNTRYRQALQYINENHQAGDAVYVYWNFVPSYKVYKQMGYLKFQAVEGSNMRAISRNDSTYFMNLNQDFKKLEGHRRVWLIYDNNLTFHIGDKDGNTWYQQGSYGNKPGKRILDNFKAVRELKESFITDQVSAHLFNLRDNRLKRAQ